MEYKDYYEILGLSPDASDDTIKKAYRQLAMQYHPDHNNGKEKWANDKFKEINEAFSVLGDSQKRSQYNQFGTMGNPGDIFTTQATRTTFEDLMNDFRAASLDFDFLADVFRDNFSGTGFALYKFRKRFSLTGKNSEPQADIGLEDLFNQK